MGATQHQSVYLIRLAAKGAHRTHIFFAQSFHGRILAIQPLLLDGISQSLARLQHKLGLSLQALK